MHGLEAAAKTLQHLVVGPAFTGRLDQLGADRNVLVAAAVIEIVMLHEHRRRQHDIRHQGGLGHELLMHRHEQVLARKTLPHQRLLRRHRHRIGVLDQHRLDRTSATKCLGIAGQDTPDPGLIEHPRGVIDRVVALDDGFVEFPERVIVEEGAAALILPGAGHGRDAQRRMHLRRPVAAAGEAIAEAEERTFGLTDQTRESLDLRHRHTANRRGPFGRAGRKMRLEFTGTIGCSGPYRRDRQNRRGTAHA